MKSLYRYIWFAALIPQLAFAESETLENLEKVGGGAGLKQADIKVVIMNIIQILLGFVGVIFLILIIWGGFQWMTSGGNDQKIGEAKGRIAAATIGLVLVLMSYAIAYSITKWLTKAV